METLETILREAGIDEVKLPLRYRVLDVIGKNSDWLLLGTAYGIGNYHQVAGVECDYRLVEQAAILATAWTLDAVISGASETAIIQQSAKQVREEILRKKPNEPLHDPIFYPTRRELFIHAAAKEAAMSPVPILLGYWMGRLSGYLKQTFM